jgi:hypothetical protein
MKNIKLSNLLLCAILLLSLLHGCKKEKRDMSPEDVVTMFYKARDAGDFETLNEILFFESEVSASQREKKIQSIISTSSEKTMMKMFAANIETKYEKILDNETAEVGVVVKAGIAGVGKNMPFNQIMLRKQDGSWKYHYSRNSLTIDELIQEIKKYPDDASLYYLLGKLVRNDNPFEGYRFCQKYYDLEPDGFWVSKEFLSKLEENSRGQTPWSYLLCIPSLTNSLFFYCLVPPDEK